MGREGAEGLILLSDLHQSSPPSWQSGYVEGGGGGINKTHVAFYRKGEGRGCKGNHRSDLAFTERGRGGKGETPRRQLTERNRHKSSFDSVHNCFTSSCQRIYF